MKKRDFEDEDAKAESFSDVLRECLVRGHGNPRGTGWTNSEFAHKVGLSSDNMITRYLNYGRLPNQTTFKNCCDVLLADRGTNISEAEQDVERLRLAWEQDVLEGIQNRRRNSSKQPYLFSELKEVGLLDEEGEESTYVFSQSLSFYATGISAGIFAIAACTYSLNLL